MHIAKKTAVIAGSTLLAAGTVLAGAGIAGAAPAHNGGYPKFANEGRYPQKTSCSGHYRLVHQTSARVGSRTVRLKYYYSAGCGSFARIENAPRNCAAWLDRTAYVPKGAPKSWDWVAESVDRGDDYAYTMVGNNLHGRVSRGALVCRVSGHNYVYARTAWY